MNGSLVPVIIAVKMRRYREAFKAVGATSPARSRSLAELGLRESLIFHKLVRQGVLVETGGGRYYLDMQRAEAVMRQRRMLVLVLISVMLVLLALGLISAL